MRTLATWPTRRVVVACVLWLLGAPVLAAIGLLLGALVLALFSGHQRISLNASLSNWTLAWFYVPPLVLLAFWLASRRQTSSRSGEVVTKPSDGAE